MMALVQPIDGMVTADHPLSTRQAFNGLRKFGQAVVRYSPEQLWDQDTRRLPAPLRAWRRKVRDFSQRELAPHALARDLCAHPPPGEWWPGVEGLVKRAAAAGLMTDMLPRPLGTAPWQRTRYLGWSQAIKTEEMARACGGQMLALCAHQLGLAPLLLSGDGEAVRRFVLPVFRDLHRGDPHLCAFAITEPAAGSDVEEGHGASLYRPGVVARRDRAGWRLSGRKVFISGGDVARTVTVFASLEGEGMDSWTCFVVHRDMPGFRVARTELKMGMRASGAAELEFDDVFVPDSHVVLGLRRGWALNRASLNFSRVPVGAMAVGFAQSAVDIVLDVVTRQSLGAHRLIDFQEIQLQVAQMIAETSAIRAMAWHYARDFKPRQAGASMTKFHASDRAQAVCEMGMDLLGEHSLLHRNRIEKVFRDTRLTRIFEGTNQINRLAVIEDVQEELAGRGSSDERRKAL